MEKDIGKITKNDQTEIIVRIDDFGGKVGLTIREYVTSDKYTGFTKAGTRISADNFKEFKKLINSINEADLKSEEKQEELSSESSESEEASEDY